MILNPRQFPDHVRKAAKAWGGDISMEITHAAARATHAPGWSTSSEDEVYGDLAHHLLKGAKSTQETLYSGHVVPHQQFKEGDTFHIPLMAASRSREIAERFARPHEDVHPMDDPHVYEFRGALGVPTDDNENEVIITGRYRVAHASPGHVVFTPHYYNRR